MKKEKRNYIEFYIKDNGDNKPEVESVKVADSGCYWKVKIKTRGENPTFEIDQIC